VTTYSRQALAERAGVDAAVIDRLVDLGIVTPLEGDAYTVGDARRIRVAESLERAGLPLEALGEAMRRGHLSLDFVDQRSYDRFAAFADVTFRQLSDRTGVPLELLLVIREAMGSAHADPDDPVRENELDVVPLLKVQFDQGIRPSVIERSLRVFGESLRRMAETEAAWWAADVMQPLFREGQSGSRIGELTRQLADDLSDADDKAVLALYHGQQATAWMKNILEGFEVTLEQTGLFTRLRRPPAICFLDLTGYTRLTEERGDEAAAELAGRLARLVERTSSRYGGKAVKWLGDGVMFHFDDPSQAVRAALEMLEGAAAAELPRAHLGLHAGPVLFQEGDYFGRTVNAAARIADYARQGEVLVSEAVVDAGSMPGVTFEEIGPVELKGIPDALRLFVARREA
jgi:class 3 adenylate cyclase